MSSDTVRWMLFPKHWSMTSSFPATILFRMGEGKGEEDEEVVMGFKP